jgi:putative flippase GtrA
MAINLTKFRFLLVGGSVAAIYFVLVLILLTLNFNAPLAAIISYLISFLIGYAGQKGLTFRSKSRHATTMPRYAILQFLCAIAAATSAAATERIGFVEPFVIAAVTTTVLGLISYYVSSSWVFRQ